MFANSQRKKNGFHAAVTQQVVKRFAEALVLVVAASGLAANATAATVTVSGTNQSAITSAISSACNGSATGTVIFPNGKYSVNTGFHVPSYCTIQAQNQGQASLDVSNNDYGIYLDGNNVTINGLIFDGGGIVTTQSSHTTPQSNVTITNNTFQNITSGKEGILSNGMWLNFNVSYNQFAFISTIPWGSVTGSRFCEGNPGDGVGGGILNKIGLDLSQIEHNTFDHIFCDAIAIAYTFSSSSEAGIYRLARNASISYNTFTNVHRMAIEVQGASGGCFGSCIQNQITNPKVAGNFSYHPYTPYFDSMTWSLVMDEAVSPFYINNTGVVGDGPNGCDGGASYGMENAGDNETAQGNVQSKASGCTINNYVDYSTGSIGGGKLVTHQNDIFYGSGTMFSWEGFNQHTRCGSCGTTLDQYNFTSVTAPNAAAPETSTLSLAFSSANNQSFSRGGNGTWSTYATDEISVVNMQFFIDASTTPIVTQELQDLNTNFAADRKWLYHATINTSNLTNGPHTISAVATDVSGAVQTVKQSFQVGNSSPTIPAISLTPASLQFGSQQLNSSTAASTITVTNTGTATLTITGIQVTGANASDFSDLSACGASLPVGTSCTLQVTFKPTAAGTRNAALSITDNAVGSTQNVPLSGTGTAAIPPPPPPPPPPPTTGTLPANLPKGMILWLANNVGLVANGASVTAWDDQSGSGNSALQANAANQPSVVPGNNGQNALHFNGSSTFMSLASLPIDGSAGMSVFLVSANAADQSNGWGNNALLYWPETASWGMTFFGSYQTSSHFRFGTMQTANEFPVSMAFSRTNSFGLNEWIHSGTTDSMWLNGQNVASFTGKVQQINGAGASALLGQGAYNTFYSGDVSEVIVYTRALLAAEQKAIEQYLMNKYHL